MPPVKQTFTESKSQKGRRTDVVPLPLVDGVNRVVAGEIDSPPVQSKGRKEVEVQQNMVGNARSPFRKSNVPDLLKREEVDKGQVKKTQVGF